MELSREQFEKFVKRLHIGCILDSYELEGDIVYEDWNVQTAWVVWEESREALEEGEGYQVRR